MDHRHTFAFYFFTGLSAVMTLAIFTLAFVWLNTRSVDQTVFGITFSWVYAQQLGLDPLQTYQVLVDDLHVQRVRLPLYWSQIEREKGVYDWSIADELMHASEERDLSITLILGMKVPRWPECHIPDWAWMLDASQQQEAVLAYMEEAVRRYKESPALIRWQVENEPFFPFGHCPTISNLEFKQRVDLVKSLDTRPIQATVSGEFGPWLDSAQAADVLGISLYRRTWNDLVGYFVYPLTPEYYFLRTQLVRRYVDDVIISELQAEPWFSEPIGSRPLSAWYDMFSEEMFEQNVAFARQVDVSEVYLWGAEWWYALHAQGDDRLWEAARAVFTNP